MYERGLGLVSLVPAAAGAGPVGWAVGGAIAAISILGKVFGGAEAAYTDFNREVRPQLESLVEDTGQPAFCAWFGEVLGIMPDGTMKNLGPYVLAGPDDMDDVRRILEAASKVLGRLHALFYGQVETFEAFEAPVPVVTAGAGGDWALLAAAGIGAVLLLGGRRKGANRA